MGKQRTQALAENAEPLREVGPPPKEERDNNCANGTIIHGSNHAETLTRRIARDRPDILERMKAGEFASVRAGPYNAPSLFFPWPVPTIVSLGGGYGSILRTRKVKPIPLYSPMKE